MTVKAASKNIGSGVVYHQPRPTADDPSATEDVAAIVCSAEDKEGFCSVRIFGDGASATIRSCEGTHGGEFEFA